MSPSSAEEGTHRRQLLMGHRRRLPAIVVLVLEAFVEGAQRAANC
jgi:hypothetical protein